MVNSNSKSLGSPGAGTHATNAGAGSNPNSSTVGGGGVPTGSSTPGAIPGAAPKAKNGPRTEVTQIVQGLGTQFPKGSETLLVKGVQTPVSSLIAPLVGVLGLFADVDGSRQSLKSKQLALKAALPGVRSLIADIKVALVALFGRGNPVLENFGINVSPRRQLTAEQRLARKAKAEQTRKQRGTLGSRQKQDVKFVGKVEVQTNVSTPAPTTGGNAGAATPPAGNGPSGSGTSQP